MEVDVARTSLVGIGGRHRMLHEPAEVVADTGLPGLVSEQAGDDAILDEAAHAGKGPFLGGHHDVAG